MPAGLGGVRLAIVTVAGNALEDFITWSNTLYHDDRDSKIIVFVKGNAGNEPKMHAYKKNTLTDAFRIISSNPDSYITVNGFKRNRRTVDNCRQLNAIVIDVDAHGDCDYKSQCSAAVAAINSAISHETLPRPNLVTFTGRGLQLLYVLDKSIPYRLKSGEFNQRPLKWAREISQAFDKRINELLINANVSAECDPTVHDAARIVRPPGSLNSKAGKVSYLGGSWSQHYYTLKELDEKIAPWKEKKARSESPKPRVSAPRAIKRTFGGDLQRKRIKALRSLQKSREENNTVKGHRELMCFLFYNCATQIHGKEKAYGQTIRFNANFSEPISLAELENIRRSVDKNGPMRNNDGRKRGFYNICDETFAAKLDMTAEELLSTGMIGGSKRNSRERKKAENASAKTARNNKIARLYRNGIPAKEIATRIGCCLKTVYNVVNALSCEFNTFKQDNMLNWKDAFARKNSVEDSVLKCDFVNFRHTGLVCAWGAGVSLVLHGAITLFDLFSRCSSVSGCDVSTPPLSFKGTA